MSTRMPRRAYALVVFAAALVACGGGADGEAPGVGKTVGVGGEAVSRSPVPGATRPARAEDVELRALAPTPVGPVLAEHAHTYPVRIEVHNVSADRVSIERMWLHASVYRDRLLVHDCGDQEAEPVTTRRTELAPGQSYVIAHGLPCGLREAGRYELTSVVMIGMPPEAVGLEPELAFAKTATLPLAIDESLPAFALTDHETEVSARMPAGDLEADE